MAQTENNVGAKFIGLLTLGVAGWGIYTLFFKKDKDEKKLSGYNILPGKSKAASQVLNLLDRDYEYAQAVTISVNEHTTGLSLNKKKKFKKKLESELNKYI